MNREKPTIASVRQYLKKNLTGLYQEGELNAIINIILTHLSGLDKSKLLVSPDQILKNTHRDKINKICNDLKNMVPVQYITGQTEFMGLEFKVSPDTLIPRQETEELVYKVISENPEPSLEILDLGTGTGCIAISLALKMKKPAITATDISEKALMVAAFNNKMHCSGIKLVHDDMDNPDYDKFGKYDIIVSNPPYVLESEKEYIGKNVLEYEPHRALFVPDDDPLIHYRSVINLCSWVLKPGGRVYLEINEKWEDEIKKLIFGSGYKKINSYRDINNKPRIIKFRSDE